MKVIITYNYICITYGLWFEPETDKESILCSIPCQGQFIVSRTTIGQLVKVHADWTLCDTLDDGQPTVIAKYCFQLCIVGLWRIVRWSSDGRLTNNKPALKLMLVSCLNIIQLTCRDIDRHMFLQVFDKVPLWDSTQSILLCIISVLFKRRNRVALHGQPLQ